MPTDTPITTARARALSRDLSINDRHRFEDMMILAAQFERENRRLVEAKKPVPAAQQVSPTREASAADAPKSSADSKAGKP
jgi:hypothetical protein